MTKINRQYKDRLFRLIFADEKNKANTLALYNALNNSSYQDTGDLELTTIDDVIYIRMKNDLSFIIADSMNLYEQQSSHNPNMPLRGFLYFASLYEKYLSVNAFTLHTKNQVRIPTPNYVVLYNGTEERPAVQELKLSDAFQLPATDGAYEWTAKVININHKDNTALLQKCKPLRDYAFLISRIQTYQKTFSLIDAIEKAVDECINSDILSDFLRAHRSEVLNVYLAEVNEELIMKTSKEEGRAEGIAEGMKKGLEQGIEQGIARGIEQGLEQGLEQGIEQGRLDTLVSLVFEEVLPIEKAASKAGMSVKDFEAVLKKTL